MRARPLALLTSSLLLSSHFLIIHVHTFFLFFTLRTNVMFTCTTMRRPIFRFFLSHPSLSHCATFLLGGIGILASSFGEKGGPEACKYV
ncbi:hypothetical protein BJV82DRAFT_611130 [Fennellomyces sp. T-0311]|nr:hypothetical protein BJV82DRAFT_611130 [Fennellomyces sp. T-0311]